MFGRWIGRVDNTASGRDRQRLEPLVVRQRIAGNRARTNGTRRLRRLRKRLGKSARLTAHVGARDEPGVKTIARVQVPPGRKRQGGVNALRTLAALTRRLIARGPVAAIARGIPRTSGGREPCATCQRGLGCNRRRSSGVAENLGGVLDVRQNAVGARAAGRSRARVGDLGLVTLIRTRLRVRADVDVRQSAVAARAGKRNGARVGDLGLATLVSTRLLVRGDVHARQTLVGARTVRRPTARLPSVRRGRAVARSRHVGETGRRCVAFGIANTTTKLITFAVREAVARRITVRKRRLARMGKGNVGTRRRTTPMYPGAERAVLLDVLWCGRSNHRSAESFAARGKPISRRCEEVRDVSERRRRCRGIKARRIGGAAVALGCVGGDRNNLSIVADGVTHPGASGRGFVRRRTLRAGAGRSVGNDARRVVDRAPDRSGSESRRNH